MNPYNIQPTIDPNIYKKTWTTEIVVGKSLLDMNEKVDNKSDKKILSFMMGLNETNQTAKLLLKDRYHFEPEDV
tara:strand:+ start:185 stop:406 length:222 start_codon:yes stop_codon:yes gene_type:complete